MYHYTPTARHSFSPYQSFFFYLLVIIFVRIGNTKITPHVTGFVHKNFMSQLKKSFCPNLLIQPKFCSPILLKKKPYENNIENFIVSVCLPTATQSPKKK